MAMSLQTLELADASLVLPPLSLPSPATTPGHRPRKAGSVLGAIPALGLDSLCLFLCLGSPSPGQLHHEGPAFWPEPPGQGGPFPSLCLLMAQ